MERGSDIFIFPEIKYKNILKYFIACKKFYKQNSKNYDAIHIHSTAVAYFHLYFAKKYGIENRVFHSHLDIDKGNFFKKIINNFFLNRILKYSTYFCACGHIAAKSMYGDGEYTFIPNGIDIEKFSFNLEKRQKIRTEMKEENSVLIGVVGRFDEVKNHKFILELANQMKEDTKYKFVLFGNGKLFDECINMQKENNLQNVIFMGNVSNISDYYNAMDLLAMPSKKEGFSLVAVEGQCNGLPILFSDTLDRSMGILEESIFLSTELENIPSWEKYIKTARLDIDRLQAKSVVSREFSIENSRKLLKEVYDSILGE